jgi:hypothetical protein
VTVDVGLREEGGLRRALEAMLKARRAFLTIERSEPALHFAQTPIGIVALHVAVLSLAAATSHLSAATLAFVAVTFAGLAVWPSRRWTIFGIAGALYFIMRPFRYGETKEFADTALASSTWFGTLQPFVIQLVFAATFLGLVFAALKAQQHWPKSAPARRPLVALVVLLSLMVALGMLMHPTNNGFALVWTLALLLSSSLFFLAYVFADAKAGRSAPGVGNLGFVRPFWGGPGVPFKGPAFLQRLEAKNDEALAATRLKALKLIVWALILTALSEALRFLFLETLGMPTLLQLITSHAQGLDASRAMGVAVLAVEFLRTIVWMGAFSHTLVALIRMSGFAIPRDMARPLSARTLAEFWNRYVFYFKEILVDFFFYPAFARYFKGNLALRTAFATFCAACLGNILFSLVSQANLFGEVGLLGVARHFESYAFYAFMLAIFLIASQLRNAKPKPEDGLLRYDILPRIWVISLFAFLLIFADETGTLRLADRLDFALWLVFLS